MTVEATLRFAVTEDDTAAAVGSGTLPVLGTPRLLAWCEAATVAALEPTLAPGSTSVGTRVTLEHRAASLVGSEVEVMATLLAADGRLHRLSVTARASEAGTVLATGEITRVVVDAAAFMGRARAR